jgi:hypothetical protein
MGIPKTKLSKAKGLGCPGFRNGRVYAEEVKEWMAGKDLDGINDEPDWAERKNQLQAEYLETKIKESQKNLVSMPTLEEYIPKCLSKAIEIAQRHMEPTKYNAFVRELKRGFQKILAPPTGE